LAPEPVRVVLDPLQIVVGDALAETDGNELTVTLTCAVFEHPVVVLVPVTVYVVFDTGLTLTFVPDPPELQL